MSKYSITLSPSSGETRNVPPFFIDPKNFKALKKAGPKKKNLSRGQVVRVGDIDIEKDFLLACLDTSAATSGTLEAMFKEDVIKDFLEDLSSSGCRLSSGKIEICRREDIGVTEDQVRQAVLDVWKNKLAHSLRIGRKHLFGRPGIDNYCSSLGNRRALAKEIDEALSLVATAPASLAVIKLLSLLEMEVATAEGLLTHLFREAGFQVPRPPRQQIITVRPPHRPTRQRAPRSHHRVAVSTRGGDSGDDESGESDPPAPPLSWRSCPYHRLPSHNPQLLEPLQLFPCGDVSRGRYRRRSFVVDSGRCAA